MHLLALFFLQTLTDHQAALDAYRQHQYPAAVEHFTAALKSEQAGSPEYRESVLLLGQSLFLQAKYADAIPWLQKAAAGNAPVPEAAYMLGNACLVTRQTSEAVKAFASLFQVPPASAAAHVATARMMMHRDMDGEAAAMAKQALALDPRIPEAHFILGEVAIGHAEIDEAIAELEREIAISPTFAMAHYRLGDAYTRREDWERATPPLERSIWLNPNFSGPFILLGKAYLKQKKLPDAEGVLRHALRLDPQNRSAHYLLGQTLMQLGRQEEAQKEMGIWKQLQAAQ